MELPSTLSPKMQRTLTRILRRSPGLILRRVLKALVKQGGLPSFDARRLAQQRPSPSIRQRPNVEPLRWRDVPGERPRRRGPLGGAAVVVKECLDVRGLPRALGTRGPNERAKRDAVLVERIRRAGGWLLGKSIMTELGVDGLGVHLGNGTPHNPRAQGYFPGGSSTGTAVAVASGLARFGVGGDGLGSVRVPSSFCGLFGLKPTHGRLPVTGMQQDAPTLAVPGPMTRTASDCALFWQVLDGQQPRGLKPLWPTRMGLMRELPPELAAPAVRSAFKRALTVLGSAVETVSVPGAGSSTTLAFLSGAYETARSPWSKQASEPTPELVIAVGRLLKESDGAWIKRQRIALRDALLRALDRCGGFIATPTTAITAPAVDAKLLRGSMNVSLLRAVGCYTPLANCTGVPAIAIPFGHDAQGRPCSLQVFGRPDSEEDLLRVALAFELL